MIKIKVFFVFCFVFLQTLYIYAGLNFDKKKFDFGKVFQNRTVKTVFHYTNKSRNIIKIKNIYSTCGCTVPLNYKKILKPGEYGKVTVMFNSETFNGRVIRKVYFETIPPIMPLPEIVISAEVLKEFSLSPSELFVKLSKKDKRQVNYITISSDVYKAFQIKAVRFNKKYFTIAISKVLPNKYTIKIVSYIKIIKKSIKDYSHKKIIFILKVKNKEIKKYLYVYF